MTQSVFEHEFIYHRIGFAALPNVNRVCMLLVSRLPFSAGFSKNELEIRTSSSLNCKTQTNPRHLTCSDTFYISLVEEPKASKTY